MSLQDKSLFSSGNPERATILKVISASGGLQLHVSAADKAKMAV
jgi:DNA-binding phage protein